MRRRDFIKAVAAAPLVTSNPTAIGIRLHHRRRRLRGLCPGQSPERERVDPRAAARGRRPARRGSVDRHAGQVGVADRLEVRLGLRDGARAGPAESPHRLSARQGPRRLERDQRDDLHSRPPVLFRSLGTRRQHRLGIRSAAAVLQEVRAQRAGRNAVSRRRWSARGVDVHRSACRPQGVPRRGGATRLQGRRALRLQPAVAGQHRGLLPEEHPRRQTAQRRRRVPHAGADAAESRSALAVPGHEADLRGQEGRRGRVPARRQAGAGARPRRWC